MTNRSSQNDEFMNIRNFSIIAHVDHGKSTLADRLLEITGTVAKDKMQSQLLDSLQLERERGITIKLAPVRMKYNFNDQEYTLNLIDTPGHVDFSYEVSRSLAAVEGTILLVDSTQGIQAQTLSHGLAALEQNLVLIPVLNKIDLPNSNVEKYKKQLIDTFGFLDSEVILVSGKTGEGVKELLQAIVERVPAPKQETQKPLKALIFDSFFDTFKGVVAAVRVVEGEVPGPDQQINFLATRSLGQVLEKGYFAPQLKTTESLKAGKIGYIATGIKEADLVHVGDTISTSFETESLPGYKVVKPMVYVGLYPIDQSEYHDIKDALERFKLNDPSFSYEPEQSKALGAGFRCGFLGLLHAEVVQERLSEEFNVDLLATSPTVEYLVDGKPLDNPAELDPAFMKNIEEPWVKLEIFSPQEFIGSVMDLVQEKRGKFLNMQHFGIQVQLSYQMPLSEMITDFYDKLKSVSSGYASLDWEFLEFREVDAVRVDILVGGEKVDALTQIVVRSRAEYVGRRLTEKLKEVLPRQNFAIALQATIGGQIIARETISPFRKDVTAKLYGGDVTRKNKLLEKQKKGKKKMKMIGQVEIPQEAFLSILKS
jgi:GTP-binding protein LepA